jgi:DNA repair exonuclease SbcCD ATPase subunit
MHTVIAVVLEQRDLALARLATLSHERDLERAQSAAEHDRFVTDLLQEHSAKQVELERQLKAMRSAAERQRALGTAPVIAPSFPVVITGAEPANNAESVQLREQLGDLRRLLEAAYVEVDDLKAVVPRLEDERDTAIRDADDTRVQLYGEIEAARDEGSVLQLQLDEAQRQMDEQRDLARDESHGWSERLSETERELDERRAEVSRLRERMDAMVTEVKFSRPPPPATSDELTRAREEAQQLRKEVIDTKRQLSRVTRELAITKMQRPGARNPQLSGVGMGAAINAKTPVPVAPGLPIAVPRPRMLTPVGLGTDGDVEIPSQRAVAAPESMPDSDSSS